MAAGTCAGEEAPGTTEGLGSRELSIGLRLRAISIKSLLSLQYSERARFKMANE